METSCLDPGVEVGDVYVAVQDGRDAAQLRAHTGDVVHDGVHQVQHPADVCLPQRAAQDASQTSGMTVG